MSFSEELPVNIEKIVYRGLGLSRHNKQVIFTPYVITGETVKVRITDPAARTLQAVPLTVIKPAQERIAPHCKYFTSCGGCHYQHIEYDYQLIIKREQVIESIQRIGKILIAPEKVKPTIPSPRIYHYRNKATFHPFSKGGRTQLGYHGTRNSLISIDNCPLLAEPLNIALLEVTEKLQDALLTSTIQLRMDGEGACHWQNDPLITVDVLGKKLQYDFDGFFQINYQILHELIDVVTTACALSGHEHVLDAFCGVGLFTLFLAPAASKVTGIERSDTAIINAECNAQTNHLPNTRFLAGDVEKVLPSLGESFDVIVLDPPRAGCSKRLIKEIINRRINRIVYVSCDPTTLARDLSILTENGYTLKWIQPLDLFPQTFHIEVVAVLIRI